MAFFSSSSINNTPEYILVGLGNPGEKYSRTRHNVGFWAIDYIGGKSECRIDRLKHFSLCGRTKISDKCVLLLKPQTFMNASGKAVHDAAAFYKIPPENIIIIQDDIALKVGSLRIRKDGSDGGHNGIKSVIENLQTQNFLRIKLGVGDRTHPDYDLADWVLSNVNDGDYKSIAENFDNIYKAIELIIGGQAEKAMSLYNKRV